MGHIVRTTFMLPAVIVISASGTVHESDPIRAGLGRHGRDHHDPRRHVAIELPVLSTTALAGSTGIASAPRSSAGAAASGRKWVWPLNRKHKETILAVTSGSVRKPCDHALGLD